MAKELLAPDYIFEASWEVCNKVGGIYTVLSTRAKNTAGSIQRQSLFHRTRFLGRKGKPFVQ